jgi:hypothetical protein
VLPIGNVSASPRSWEELKQPNIEKSLPLLAIKFFQFFK